MNDFEPKMTLTVYSQTDKCPLNHNELLAFSYMLFQDRWDCRPSFRKTAFKSGLNERTVSDICDRLRIHGLLNADFKPTLSVGTDWFLEKTPTGSHVSQRLRYRQTFVRDARSDNPLSSHAVSIYSYLRNCAISGFEPASGWNKAYISTVLKIDVDTVAASLRTLDTEGFVKFGENPFSVGLVRSLSPGQMRCFADAADFKENKKSGKVGFVGDDFVPETAVAPVEEKRYHPSVKKMWDFVEHQLLERFGVQHAKLVEEIVVGHAKDENRQYVNVRESRWNDVADYIGDGYVDEVERRSRSASTV